MKDAKAAPPAAAPAKDMKAGAPAAAAAPAAPAGMEAPKPAAELAALKGYEGKWKCEGKVNDSMMGPGHAMKNKVEVKTDLGGFFMSMRLEEQKSKVAPMPYSMQSFMGWDGAKKALVRSDVDNMGGVAHFTAPASWDGDKHVWTGELMGPMGKTGARHTFMKKGDKEMTSTFEMQGKDGAWMTLTEETCKK
jgi:hypothetical protein